MSRITHFKQQPVNMEFWDYYILCHLNADVALAIQRMEYWDGTKDNGNTHAENINDAMAKAGKVPNQDTSYWIYKSQDELQWELMGILGEKRLPKVLDFLVNDLKYIDRRTNPFEGWDRKKQYEFQASVVQEHINYLGYIIAYFNLPLRHLHPVFYAIEVLTREQVYIDTLNVELVLGKIEQLKNNPKLPHFLKNDFEKFAKVFIKPVLRSFRTLSEWKETLCGMDSDKVRNGNRPNADCIPTNRGSNSIEDYTENSNIEDEHNEDTFGASIDSAVLTQLQNDYLSTKAQLEQALKQIEVMRNTPPSDTPLTPVGKSTVPDGGNPSSIADTPVDHNVIPKPPCSATDGLTQESPVTTHSENAPSENAPQTQEMPSSTQAVESSSNQATEQQQASDDSPIATGATKKSGKSTGSKGKGKKKDAEPVEPVPPPTRPDPEMTYGVEKILAWGDYFRGYPLPESTSGTSRCVKAKKAAERWIRRGLTEKRFVTILRFMRGVKITLENDEEFRDKWWPEHCPADVWHVEEQCDTMVLEINQLRALKNGQPIDFNSRRVAVEAAAATRQPTNSLPPIPEGWTPPSKKVSGGI